MSKNKVKVLTKNLISRSISFNTLSIKLLKNANGVIDRLAIHEAGETNAHEYTLSTQDYVAFKVTIESTSSEDSYFWNLDTNILAQTSLEINYNTEQLTKYPMNFGNSPDINNLTLNIIGTDDLRIGIVSVSSDMGSLTEIGFRLKIKSGKTWLRIAYYFPVKS